MANIYRSRTKYIFAIYGESPSRRRRAAPSAAEIDPVGNLGSSSLCEALRSREYVIGHRKEGCKIDWQIYLRPIGKHSTQ